MTGRPSHRHRESSERRVLRGPIGRASLTVAVVVAIFAGVLPQIADYGGAWEVLRSMSSVESIVVLTLAVVFLVSYEPLWMVAVPGLSWWRAFLADQVSTALTNTVPVGFAFGVGTTAAMYHSFGFSPATITRAVAVTGLWNSLVKLTMPALALAGVLLVGGVTRAFTVAAVVGIALLLLAGGLLVLGLVHRRTGMLLAGAAERLVGVLARLLGRKAPAGWVERTDQFRTDSRELLRSRWPWLSVAAVANHAVLFVLLLACLRSVDGEGADVHWVVVLAVFSLTQLVTIVPITPGALGIAELTYVAGLTSVGVAAGLATGAVLLFRFLTWFLPIPTGLVTWLLWRRGAGRTPAAGDAPGR